MPAINITDLNNAKTDVDHIADIATSEELTATDRLGNIKKTVAGAIYDIAGITNRGAWAATTAYATKDIVFDSGSWYVCVVAHTSGATFAGDSANWRLYQGVTSGDLAATTGAGMSGFSRAVSYSSGTVGDRLSKEIFVTDAPYNGDIQAALTAVATSGEPKKVTVPPDAAPYLLTVPLVISANTELNLMTGAEIKNAAGVYRNLLQNACWANRATNGIDVTGNVFWQTALGGVNNWKALIGGIVDDFSLQVGDYVWLTGSNEMAYRGVFPVIEISGTDAIVKLDRLPMAGPTGTMTVRRADENIKITGGLWNYNSAELGPTVSDITAHCIVMAGLHNPRWKDLEFKNTVKFCMSLAALDTFELDGIYGPHVNSDMVKIYGPAFRGKMRKFRGFPGDDFLSLHNGENALFAGYFMDKGDIRNIDVDDLALTNGEAGAALMTSIYPEDLDCRIENIKLRNYTGNCAGTAIQILDYNGGGTVGDITIENFNATAQKLFSITTHTGTTTVKSLRASLGPNAQSTTGAHLINIEAPATVNSLEVFDTEIDNTSLTGSQLIRVEGQVLNVKLTNVHYKVPASGVIGFSTGTKLLKSLTITNSDIECTNEMFPWSTITFSQTPRISTYGGVLKAATLFEVASTMQFSFHGTLLDHSAYAVRGYGGTAPIITVFSEGAKASASWFTATGDAKFNPKSFDIVDFVDAAYMNRAPGNRMTTINGAGTIPSGAPCINDQTNVANSWHSIKDPTVEKY